MRTGKRDRLQDRSWGAGRAGRGREGSLAQVRTRPVALQPLMVCVCVCVCANHLHGLPKQEWVTPWFPQWVGPVHCQPQCSQCCSPGPHLTGHGHVHGPPPNAEKHVASSASAWPATSCTTANECHTPCSAPPHPPLLQPALPQRSFPGGGRGGAALPPAWGWGHTVTQLPHQMSHPLPHPPPSALPSPAPAGTRPAA